MGIVKTFFRKPFYKKKWFLFVIFILISVIGYFAWDIFELKSNNAQIVVTSPAQPIAKVSTNRVYILTVDSIEFVLDTGTPYSFINQEDADRLKASSMKPVVTLLQDTNGTPKFYFGKVTVDSLPIAEGVYLNNVEFVLKKGEKSIFNKNYIGMDILQKTTLIFERNKFNPDSVKVYMLPSRPPKYAHKLADIHAYGGYIRDMASTRYYVDVTLNGKENRYFIDTAGSLFKLPTADSIRITNQDIVWSASAISYGSHSSKRLRIGDFQYMCKYIENGSKESSVASGRLNDYITKYALNPVTFFPFSVAIDFQNKAIYTVCPIADFSLVTEQ